MIAARILQGLGGAGLMSVNTALVRYALQPRGSPDLVSMPWAYLAAALETGVVFR